MKKSGMVSIVAVFFLFVSGYGIAQTDSTKPAGGPPAATEHADHASHGAAEPTAQPPAPPAAGHDMSQMGGMEDMKQQEDAMATHMKAMQTLMEKINATENPAERKQLLAEYMAAMASGIKMMREMDHKMMMGMMQPGKCPMMERMSSPQGHEGMQGMMGTMPMCHAMMQNKAERYYSMMEQIIESQKQLLKLVP